MSQTNMYVDCPKCKSTLQYPCGATLVRCPSCHWITNTTAPQQLPCISCHTLLAFPPHSLYIRCPKCFVTIHIRDHQYKNELLSNKDTTNIMLKSFQNLAPLLRIDPYSIQSNNNNNTNPDDQEEEEDDDINDNDNESKDNIHDIIKNDMITKITYQHDQQLKEIVSKYPSIKGKRKYKYFDPDLLNNNNDESSNDDNDESILILPQLNTKKDTNNRYTGKHRILTGFQCYCNEQRSIIIKNNVSMSEIQISNQLAINWKKLKLEQRQKYVDKALHIVDKLIDTYQ